METFIFIMPKKICAAISTSMSQFMFCDDQKCAHDGFETMTTMLQKKKMKREKNNNLQPMNLLEGEILKFCFVLEMLSNRVD